jgi:hypothetical protein
VSVELELLQGFRAEDAAVDAASVDAARSQLLAHIAATGSGEGGARPARRLRRPRVAGWIRGDLVAIGFAVIVVIAVVAVFVGIGGQHAARHTARPPIRHGNGSLTLLNLAPASPPRLPGQFYCDAGLAPPGVIPGLGGRRSGRIVVNRAMIQGVNESPFSLTARGLAPSVRAGEYAVWIIQVSGGVPLAGAKPRLLGVIAPGVGPDGAIAVAGVLPRSDVNGTYAIRITVQPRSGATKPGRTVLQGVASL